MWCLNDLNRHNIHIILMVYLDYDTFLRPNFIYKICMFQGDCCQYATEFNRLKDMCKMDSARPQFSCFNLSSIFWERERCDHFNSTITYAFAVVIKLEPLRTPFYKHGLSLIRAWISNRTHHKMWDDISYPFPNFDGATMELLEGK